MKARFNKVKNRYVNKFTFDNNTTLGIGNVQPLFCKQLVGGSKVSVSFGQLTRLSPLVVPSFARLKQRNDFVFVPMAMVMPAFDAFLSQSVVYGTSKRYVPDSLPCITNQALFMALVSRPALCNATILGVDGNYSRNQLSNFSLSFYGNTTEKIPNFVNGMSGSVATKDLPLSFFDFVLSKQSDKLCSNFGNEKYCFKLTQSGRFWLSALRGLGYTLDPNDVNPVSLLPLWAFVKACYDLYYPKRDNPWHASNYYASINAFYNGNFKQVNVGSLVYDIPLDYHYLVSLFGSDGSFDFFVSSDDSLATAATIDPINFGSAASRTGASVFNNVNKVTDPFEVSSDSSGSSTKLNSVPSLTATSGDSTSISADQLTLVNRLWNFVQKSSVVGQSVKDWFAVHLGQKTNEDMFDQSVLVQSIINDVSINPVISTAQTSDGAKGDNLGALAGQGYASKNGNVHFEARTFGYFMCLTSLYPVSGVSCGTQPEMYCNTLYEQQLPDFDGVGYEVLNKSSFCESLVDTNSSTTFTSAVNGGFGYVPRLSSWKTLHSIRSGNFALPQLNGSLLPYCADVLPLQPTTAGIIWRFPWSQHKRFVSFNRMFYNTDDVKPLFGSAITIPLDDNFMSQSVFEFSYTSYLKPLSDSYSVESLGNDLISVKEQ